MRPREFWISIDGASLTIESDPNNIGPIDRLHVREVVPIDWEKVYEGLKKHSGYRLTDDTEKLIQQLVERQMAGEE